MKFVVCSTLSAAVALLAGCNQGMDDIDARVRRTLDRTTTAKLDGGARTPDRAFPPTDTAVGPREREKSPPITNPPASELSYTAASEARDVSQKLDSYQAELQPRPGQTVTRLDLETALRSAQAAAPEFLTAEESYIFSTIAVLQERRLWEPIFSNVTTLGVSGRGDDGSFASALNVLNTLQVSQRLPRGGSVQAQWLWEQTETIRSSVAGGGSQSSALALSGNIPLLRGAGYAAQESLIQAERGLIYAAREYENFRRNLMVAIARDYFALLESSSRLRSQARRVALLENITAGEQARFEAGRIAEFSKNRAENDLLSARASLASQREAFIVELEQFKIRLGLGSRAAVDLVESELPLPEPDVTLDRAVELAFEYRLDLQTRRDQVDDARRGVSNARNETLPDLNVTGSVTVPTDPRDNRSRLDFSPNDLDYRAGVSLGLPLDRVSERLALRRQTIELQRAQREYERFRDNLAVEVRQAVRNIDLSRFQLVLAERQVEVNRRRVEETELKADVVDTLEKVDAANSLLEAENARDRARTTLRNAVLAYLRLTGQLRVARDGTIERLPGMDGAPAAPASPPAAPAEAPPPPPPEPGAAPATP